jgi:hypothetical protein
MKIRTVLKVLLTDYLAALACLGAFLLCMGFGFPLTGVSPRPNQLSFEQHCMKRIPYFQGTPYPRPTEAAFSWGHRPRLRKWVLAGLLASILGGAVFVKNDAARLGLLATVAFGTLLVMVVLLYSMFFPTMEVFDI